MAQYDMAQLARDAFNKIASYVYFDNQNLLIRKELAQFIKDRKHDLLDKFADSIDNYSPVIGELIDKIGLTLLPKNVKENSNLIDSKFLSKRFYTNQIYKDSPLVDRINVFIDAPFEVHLISAMWLLKFGKYFDEGLGSHCRGNRLEYNDNRLKGRLLFKRYESEYQKWWSEGIESAKSLFAENKDVTILNFDFKNYYHSIELNLDSLTDEIFKHDINYEYDSLHSIFIEIHKKYYKVLFESGIYELRSFKNYVCLPIGLLSSGVLANWYLKDFDTLLMSSIHTQYYGRYVDDLMIVIENSMIERFNNDHVQNIISRDIRFKSDQDYLIHYFITQVFPQVFRLKSAQGIEDAVYLVNHSKYQNLVLQSSKFFIYQFNAEFSPQLLNKFIEEQEEKSSAFNFLSEDDDNIYKDLDKITFETNFDNQEWGVNGLKHIEENKFKLSVYLTKLARGSAVSGSDYDPEEAEKVKKYFKGFYLLRNYFFWEKVLSIWLLRNDFKAFFAAIKDIKNQINSLEVKTGSALTDSGNRKSELQKGLRNYLSVAINMCTSLLPTVIDHDSDGVLSNDEKSDVALYRNTFLIRKNFVSYPLIQFTGFGKSGTEALFKKEIIDSLTEVPHDSLRIVSGFFPYRIKFYECCLFAFIRQLNKTRSLTTDEKKYEFDYFSNDSLLQAAFETFCLVNAVKVNDREEVKEKYFSFLDAKSYPVRNVSFPADIIIRPLKIPGQSKTALRVCLANKFVDARESGLSMMGRPKSDVKRYEEFNRIFDEVKKVKDPDVLVMPEIALPYHFLPQSALFSVTNQTALVTGMEHWRVGRIVFNFVVTVLPLRVYDDNDGVIVPRLKNHYAPEEESIVKKDYCVPKPKPYQYDLILWRGVYFSVYYCFELADVRHRNIMLGLVDVILAPVWNKDVHYYNSLVESASRDMHCFIVLANTTQFGDSRITRPSEFIRRDKLRVKGGTVKDHKAIVMVSDLEIDMLRSFQMGDFEKKESEPLRFKPLPPDFPVNAAVLRRRLRLFEMRDSDNPFDDLPW